MTTLRSGERQVAPDLSGIRRDHVARYEFAAELLVEGSRVLDLACGVGYGAAVLADAGHRVVGVDNSADSIDYARAHYARDGSQFRCADAGAVAQYRRDAFDAAVCFETIEHVADPLPILKALRVCARRLIASVPNEAVFPFAGHAFHHRHYTRGQFAALLAKAGWEPVEWHGQLGPHSEVEPDIEGRTLIVVAKRARKTKPLKVCAQPKVVVTAAKRRRTATKVAAGHSAPKHVAILGLGPTVHAYLNLVKRLGSRRALADEVWAINALGDVVQCDRIFHMDDVRIQEIRAAAAPASNIAAMLTWLKQHQGPIYTSRPHREYPGLVEFPLEDVVNNLGELYFNNTAAYAIAYAVHIGVQAISLFGIDFSYAHSHHAERGRGCCEYWLGVAMARGIEIRLPAETSLLDACAPASEKTYGYDMVDLNLQTVVADGVRRARITMTERATPPTAAQIEARYDHSQPTVPAALRCA